MAKMSIMMFLLMFVAYSFASNCSPHTNCGDCVSHMGGHNCVWCTLDMQCHDVGSPEDPCSNGLCISKSSLSTCKLESCDNICVFPTCSVGSGSVCGADLIPETTHCLCPNLNGRTCPPYVPAPNSPEEVHIAFAGDDGHGNSNGMAVSWMTQGMTNTSTVVYGLESGSYNYKAQGIMKSYLKTFHHHVVLFNLKPSTKYYYKCGDSEAGWSGEYYFTTAPTAQPKQGFVVSVYGDMGFGVPGHAVETRTSLEKLKSEVNFVWHVGDVAYADDSFIHGDENFLYEKVYNQYMTWMENITAQMPYMVLPGNHESECHSPACILDTELRTKLQNFSAYFNRFRMPDVESGGVGPMWYSFNYGNMHFVSMNTETDWPGAPEEHRGDSGLFPAGGFGRPGEFMSWLENDLAKAHANRANRPWIVVGGHRPLYCGLQNSSGQVKLRETFEDLFRKYEVDIVFTGHVHSYERTFPVYNGSYTKSYVNPGKTAYVVIGCAGNDEMGSQKITLPKGQPPLAPIPRPIADPPGWSAFRDTEYYGTGLLRVHNNTHLTWQFIHSVDNSVADEFTLVKNL
eukprot:NODE_1675_length_1850_cov_43.215981_g1420_i0.p1 GENE.NODE_1675_length_1850_cov_43.215981_g1420_i0~~NODE_1675_length_1850_cov_43.215981_g1420_i0.p1  ORF type:complete len:585 (-),score=122.44 NODE_1675_length_1850_cov_43.215981_g1420_i0:95-1801(-)